MYSPFLWQALLLLPVSNTPGKKRQYNIILSDYSHSFVHLPQALKQSLMLLNTNLDLLPTQKNKADQEISVIVLGDITET